MTRFGTPGARPWSESMVSAARDRVVRFHAVVLAMRPQRHETVLIRSLQSPGASSDNKLIFIRDSQLLEVPKVCVMSDSMVMPVTHVVDVRDAIKEGDAWTKVFSWMNCQRNSGQAEFDSFSRKSIQMGIIDWFMSVYARF